MPVSILVNKLTPSHKGSNGTCIAFPDVCKTPTPGGPIPIPYPNVAKSSDLMSGSTTVKMDGQPVCIKGCNFMMSTGDEAGSALGIVSNKIKGKAEFVNYSFDVKVDGQNVCRLVDPMQQNMGSGNGFGPALMQEPKVAFTHQAQECKEVTKKQEEQKKKESQWSGSGITPGHQNAIQQAVNKLKKYTIFFRQTSKHCSPWIEAKHKPKPHEVITASTLKEGKSEALFKEWLRKYHEKKTKFLEGEKAQPKEHAGRFHETYKASFGAASGDFWDAMKKYELQAPPIPASPDQSHLFYGLVVSLEDGEPLVGYGTDDQGNAFWGKWITGDYDMMDILTDAANCGRMLAAWNFATIKKTLNKHMGWDGIQHGPQSYWVAKSKAEGGHDFASFSMPEKMKEYMRSNIVDLNGPGADRFKVPIAEGRTMNVLDNKLTAVAPNGGVVYLESYEDVKGALKCFGCARPDSEAPMKEQIAV